VESVPEMEINFVHSKKTAFFSQQKNSIFLTAKKQHFSHSKKTAFFSQQKNSIFLTEKNAVLGFCPSLFLFIKSGFFSFH
jgi:hypothetical protein